MSVPFPIFHTEGTAPKQAHTNLPEGTYEREQGREGFTDAVTHFYHRRPPMAWKELDGPDHPRLFDFRKYQTAANSPWDALTVFYNDHTQFRVWRSSESMDHLVRNADGDDLLFVHEGRGEFFSDHGHFSFRAGDYILIPRATTWRMEIAEPVMVLLLEATGESYRLPDRGILGVNAMFDPDVLEKPKLDGLFQAQNDDETRVHLKRRGRITKITFPYNPLDAVGWKGNVMPLRMNWRDVRPIMAERYHLPPSAHTLFVSERIVIGSFVPRPMESSDDALKLPFFHNNDDFEEVGFLHDGEFMSKDAVGPGCLFNQPSGVTHGPHPKAYDKAQSGKLSYTNEVLFFFETRDPLDRGQIPAGIEFEDYVNSWKAWLPRLDLQAAE